MSTRRNSPVASGFPSCAFWRAEAAVFAAPGSAQGDNGRPANLSSKQRLEHLERLFYQLTNNYLAMYWHLKNKGIISDEEMTRAVLEVGRLRKTTSDENVAHKLQGTGESLWTPPI